MEYAKRLPDHSEGPRIEAGIYIPATPRMKSPVTAAAAAAAGINTVDIPIIPIPFDELRGIPTERTPTPRMSFDDFRGLPSRAD